MRKNSNQSCSLKRPDNFYYNKVMQTDVYDQKGKRQLARKISLQLPLFSQEIALLQNPYPDFAIGHLSHLRIGLTNVKEDVITAGIFTSLIEHIKAKTKQKPNPDQSYPPKNKESNDSPQKKQSEKKRQYIGSSVDLDENEREFRTPNTINISEVLSEPTETTKSADQKERQQVEKIRGRLTKQIITELAQKQTGQIYLKYILILQFIINIVLAILQHVQDQNQPSNSWIFSWIQPLAAAIFEIVFFLRGKIFCCNCCEGVRNYFASSQIKQRLKQRKIDEQIYAILRCERQR